MWNGRSLRVPGNRHEFRLRLPGLQIEYHVRIPPAPGLRDEPPLRTTLAARRVQRPVRAADNRVIAVSAAESRRIGFRESHVSVV